MNDQTQTKDQVVDQLNSFLRGELSAVETYRQAIEKLQGANSSGTTLRECMDSHQQRVALLQSRIRNLGGTPAADSGAWGALAKLVEGGAALFGEKTAIAALEEGEDHGIKDYTAEDLAKLDAESRQLVSQFLLPAQQRTHRSLSDLKRALN